MASSTSDANFDLREFRRALGSFATGVTIITAQSADGEKVGVTASSFNSLSLDPPLILWSSIKQARSCAIFESASHFTVNILAADQMDMSNHFARQQEDKFAGIKWTEGLGGAPVFPNCAGNFQCETYNKIDGGDHWIFIGRVVEFSTSNRPPLAFHQGAYSMVINHPASGPTTSDEVTTGVTDGRLGNHAFYLLLMAVRAYQSGYQPKQEALGLSAMEARCLIVLSDLPGIGAEELTTHTHINSTVAEVREALPYLESLGLVTAQQNGYFLTSAGLDKANYYWKIASSHAKDIFKEFSSEQVATFKDVLRGVIKQGL